MPLIPIRATRTIRGIRDSVIRAIRTIRDTRDCVIRDTRGGAP